MRQSIVGTVVVLWTLVNEGSSPFISVLWDVCPHSIIWCICRSNHCVVFACISYVRMLFCLPTLVLSCHTHTHTHTHTLTLTHGRTRTHTHTHTHTADLTTPPSTSLPSALTLLLTRCSQGELDLMENVFEIIATVIQQGELVL